MDALASIEYQVQHIHDDRTKAIIVSHAIVLPLAIVAVGLRFISRRLCKAQVQADDYTIIVALVTPSDRFALDMNCLLG